MPGEDVGTPVTAPAGADDLSDIAAQVRADQEAGKYEAFGAPRTIVAEGEAPSAGDGQPRDAQGRFAATQPEAAPQPGQEAPPAGPTDGPPQAGPLPGAPQVPPAPHMPPLELDGRVFTQEQVAKDPAAWQSLCQAMDQSYSREGRWTQRMQELAEQRRQVETEMVQAQGDARAYRELMEAIGDPMRGPSAFINLAQAMGWKGLSAELLQSVQQWRLDPTVQLAEKVQALEARIEEGQVAQDVERRRAVIEQSWGDLKSKNPWLVDSDLKDWIGFQMNDGMSAEAAFQRMKDQRASLYRLDLIDKLPEAVRKPLEDAWRKKYLTQKQAGTFPTLAGPSGTPVIQAAQKPPPDTSKMSDDEYAELVRRELSGVTERQYLNR